MPETFCRGVYLAAVCYNEDDKILVTTEDNLPIVEVDESYNGNSLQLEFDWLMKVIAASWDTARQIKQDLEKLSALSSAHLKHQLLTAVLQLQVCIVFYCLIATLKCHHPLELAQANVSNGNKDWINNRNPAFYSG